MYIGVQYTVSSGVRNAQALAFCVMLCRSLSIVLFLVELCCLSFSDSRLVITPLVSLDLY